MSNRTTKHDGLAEDARWTRNRPPSGEIVCNGRPMAFWLPEDDSDDSAAAGGQPKRDDDDDSVNDLTDEVRT